MQNHKTDHKVREYGPALLGIVFAILQGFTVYFTKNVETSLSKLEEKLDQTWDITLVTQTKIAALETNVSKLDSNQADYERQLREIREEYLRHVAEYPR